MSNTTEQSTLTWGKTLIKKIERASKKAPRFLFAYGFMMPTHRNQSVIIDPEVIMPDYFLHADMPSRFHHMPRETFCAENEAFFGQEKPQRSSHAMWSVWDLSLHSVIAGAVECCARNGWPMRIVSVAVLDTKRLASANLVLHEGDLHLVEHVGRAKAPVGDFFHVFGRIRAERSTFAMVTLDTLHEQSVLEKLLGLSGHSNPQGITFALTDVFADAADWPEVPRKWTGNRWSGDIGFEQEITIAKEFGKAFGKHFALPVACMAIATLGRHPQHQLDWLQEGSGVKSSVVEGFNDMDVVRQSFKGQSIMREKKCLLATPDARRGMNLFRMIIKSRQAKHKKRGRSVQDLTDGFSRFKLGVQSGLLEEEHEDDSVFSPSPDTSVASSDDEDEGSSDEEDKPLPAGRMDDDTKRRLLLAQKRTPRYLFRAWNNTDHLSGGFKDLNSATAITPRAYLHNKAKAAPSIYDMTANQLRSMCEGHLRSNTLSNFYSELSSWASSIQVAFSFARGQHCYISIIDTQELSEKNAIVHVPSLGFVFGSGLSYAHEYLAHGVITGPALKAVPLQAFRDAGVLIAWGHLLPMSLSSAFVARISPVEIAAARNVADLYGGKFAAAVFVAVLTLKQRSWNFWRSEKTLQKALPLFVKATETYWIPHELCGDATILTDIVYTTGYENVEQMIKMLRALVNWRHGKGARGRAKSLVGEWLW